MKKNKLELRNKEKFREINEEFGRLVLYLLKELYQIAIEKLESGKFNSKKDFVSQNELKIQNGDIYVR